MQFGKGLSLVIFTPYRSLLIPGIWVAAYLLAATFFILLAIFDRQVAGSIISVVSVFLWWQLYLRKRIATTRPPGGPDQGGAGRPVEPEGPTPVLHGKDAKSPEDDGSD